MQRHCKYVKYKSRPVSYYERLISITLGNGLLTLGKKYSIEMNITFTYLWGCQRKGPYLHLVKIEVLASPVSREKKNWTKRLLSHPKIPKIDSVMNFWIFRSKKNVVLSYNCLNFGQTKIGRFFHFYPRYYFIRNENLQLNPNM